MKAVTRLIPLASLGLLVACGTTVPTAAQLSGADGLAPAPALPGGSVQAPTTQGGLAGTGAAALAPGQATARTTAGSATGPAGPDGGAVSASGATALAPTGRGWDRTSISIGVLTQKDAQAAFASVGYSGIDPGNTEAQARAVVDELNRQGGVLGRRLKIVTYDVPTISSAQNPDQAATQACTYFSQDHPVVAVFNIVHTIDKTNFRACFAAKHVPVFNAALSVIAQADVQKLAPYLYSLGTPTWDVLAPAFVARLKAQHYFEGWDARLGRPVAGKAPVIGLLTADNPLGHADETIIKKALAQAGYRDVVTYSYTPPGSEIDPAVLHFAQNGVTHVISDDIELVTFQIHAQAQSYTPRYGISTFNAPEENLTEVGPDSQQVGDVGVGWAPTYDVADGQDPGAFSGGAKTCLAMMAKAGVTFTDRLARANALALCDAIRLATTGMAAGNGLGGEAIFAGVVRSGLSFSPAFTFGSGLTAQRLFLPARLRDLVWSTGCACMRYAGSGTHTM